MRDKIMQQRCRSIANEQRLELAVLLRPDGGGPPIALATLDDAALLRAVLEKMIGTLRLDASRTTNPVSSRALFAQMRTLREYLHGIE